MKALVYNPAIVLAAILFAQTSGASTISYELQDLGLNSYRYVYTVANDGTLPGGSAIQLFDILFDPALYQEASLTISSDPILAADWTQQIFASAPGIPAAYDVLANGSGITLGQQLSGFAVDFIWMGAGLPGAQVYEIYDSSTFDLLESGTTISSVPLPGAGLLMASALVLMTGFLSRKKITVR